MEFIVFVFYSTSGPDYALFILWSLAYVQPVKTFPYKKGCQRQAGTGTRVPEKGCSLTWPFLLEPPRLHSGKRCSFVLMGCNIFLIFVCQGNNMKHKVDGRRQALVPRSSHRITTNWKQFRWSIQESFHHGEEHRSRRVTVKGSAWLKVGKHVHKSTPTPLLVQRKLSLHACWGATEISNLTPKECLQPGSNLSCSRLFLLMASGS